VTHVQNNMCMDMGVGRGGARGLWRPLDFENVNKKGYFLSFEWENTNLTTSSPPRKILEKSPSAPPGKNQSDAHVHGRIHVCTVLSKAAGCAALHYPLAASSANIPLSRFSCDMCNSMRSNAHDKRKAMLRS